MGFNISWLAIEGKASQRVLDELGLITTGRREELPESPVVGTALPNGWYLVWVDHFDESLDANTFLEALCDHSAMKTLSAGCRVVLCHVQETAMYSSAVCWTNGRSTWTLEPRGIT